MHKTEVSRMLSMINFIESSNHKDLTISLMNLRKLLGGGISTSTKSAK